MTHLRLKGLFRVNSTDISGKEVEINTARVD